MPECGIYASTMRKPRPTRTVEPWKKNARKSTWDK